ncbi:hypothetical protein GCM10022255_024770 [Dactylosporangium darangshiense]|uniref:Uncharacterized protein n=1 Tax=Dactylosporangium darangshiense TaxID=579108 RepID=A0ABP8D626_9ACTN
MLPLPARRPAAAGLIAAPHQHEVAVRIDVEKPKALDVVPVVHISKLRTAPGPGSAHKQNFRARYPVLVLEAR